jgi:Tfp pilus assembly protein PilF
VRSADRWFLDRNDSPWYPTARLFRQNKRGDWDGVLATVRSALRERIDTAAGACAPMQQASPPALGERYFAAVELIETRRDAVAEAALKSILADDPCHAAALRRMAWICHKRGEDAEAAAMLARAIEREPQNAEAHCNLGLVLATLGRHRESEASYRRGLALNPGSVDGHNNLGVLLEKVGRYREAEASYRRAMGIAPLLAHIPNNLGVLLKESGRLAEAITVHRQARELDPHLPAASSNLLYTLNYYEAATPQSLFDAHAAWGRVEGVRYPTGGGARSGAAAAGGLCLR